MNADQKMYIKNTADWGYLVDKQDDVYYLAMFGDTKEVKVFYRYELTIPKLKKS